MSNASSTISDGTCSIPPTIPFQESVHVLREISPGNIVVLNSPYKYSDMAFYSCRTGYEKVSNVKYHYCNSRSGWTGTAACKLKLIILMVFLALQPPLHLLDLQNSVNGYLQLSRPISELLGFMVFLELLPIYLLIVRIPQEQEVACNKFLL